MIAKQLWPDRDELGQCEAQREGRYLNDTPGMDKRCAHSAKFAVEGKRLCQRHAGQAALRVLMGKSESEFINAAIKDARHFERQRDHLLEVLHRVEEDLIVGASDDLELASKAQDAIEAVEGGAA